MLVITYRATGKKKSDLSGAIAGTVIDPQTGNIISSKVLFTNNDPGLGIQLKTDRDGEYNFQNLFLNKVAFNKNLSRQCDLLYFDNDLNLKQDVVLTTKLNESGTEFFGSTANSKGTSFIVGYTDKEFFCEKFEAGNATPVSRLSTKSSKGDNNFYSCVLMLNKSNEEEADMSVRYKNEDKDLEIHTMKFDFASNVAKAYEQTLGKAFETLIGKKNAENLELVGLDTYKDKILVIQEFHWNNLGPQGSMIPIEYHVADVIVSVLDENMQPLKHIGLGKSFYSTFPSCTFAGHKILNNQLIILNNVTAGYGYEPWITKINLDDLTSSEPTILSSNDHLPIEGTATLWLGNVAYLQYYTSFKKDHDAILQKVEF